MVEKDERFVQILDQTAKFCERYKELDVSRHERLRLVEKYDEEMLEEILEIQDLLQLKPDINLHSFKEELREEVINLETTVEKSRETKRSLQSDKKAKSQMLANIKQEFESLQNDCQKLEAELMTENQKMPIILRLMKSHNPGPDNKHATKEDGTSNNKENLA